MLCVRGGTQAPRGEPEGVTSVDRPGRSSDEQLRIGSLLVSVEGEPKSFLPPAPLYYERTQESKEIWYKRYGVSSRTSDSPRE